VVVIRNDTGGAATFTLKLSARAKAPATAYGTSVSDPTVALATGKTMVLRLDHESFRETDQKVTVECNVAGKIIVLSPG
jgi:hypothetical protein